MTAAPTSRKLPEGWRPAGAGRAIFDETGTEVHKTTIGWTINVPQRPGPKCGPAAVQTTTDFFPTRAAAVEAASPIIERTRDLIAGCWDDAHFHAVGRPSTWPALGEVRAEVVAARRRAVIATGTPTGRTATDGQLVVHIATGVPGRFHGTVTYDRPFHGMTGLHAGVTFAGELPFPVPVHPDDVVVLTDDPLHCLRHFDDDHDHWQAVRPECLIETPDADIEGPELVQTRPGHYEAADGVHVDQHTDGTWSATGTHLTGGHGELICSGHKRIGSTYRTINWWRATRALAHRILTAYAKITGWRSNEVRLAAIRAEIGDVDLDDFDSAMRQLWRDSNSTFLAIEPGQPLGADDHETALTLDGMQRHTITVWDFTLDAWAKAAGIEPTVAARGVFWRDRMLTYRDTGRPVDEPMPTHVIIHVITDRAAYADHLEVQAATRNPSFRDDLLRIAADVRDGTRPTRQPYVEYFSDLAAAEQYVDNLRRHHGNPGRAYEVVAVAGTGSCEYCHQPVLLIDGTWRHHTCRFPIDCANPFDGEAHTAAPKDSGPGPDSPGLDDTQTQTPTTQTPTLTPPPVAPAEPTGPGPDRPVAFGFSIQTQTDGQWRTVRVGHTPPMYRPDPDLLHSAAETVLGKASSLLGLGPREQTPPVRVQTWHRPSGLVGSATNAH